MNWNNSENKRLVEAFLTLETPDEARLFLRDLMTEAEITEFAKRLEVAILLTNKTPYSSIEKKTGLSSATIARVAKWLAGPNEGYRQIIAKLHHSKHAKPGRGLC